LGEDLGAIPAITRCRGGPFGETYTCTLSDGPANRATKKKKKTCLRIVSTPRSTFAGFLCLEQVLDLPLFGVGQKKVATKIKKSRDKNKKKSRQK
jgi:hypothetical protein